LSKFFNIDDFVSYCINSIIPQRLKTLSPNDYRLFQISFFLCMCNFEIVLFNSNIPFVNKMIDSYLSKIKDTTLWNNDSNSLKKITQKYYSFKNRFKKKLLLGQVSIIEYNSYKDKGYSIELPSIWKFLNYIQKNYNLSGENKKRLIYEHLYIGISFDVLKYYTDTKRGKREYKNHQEDEKKDYSEKFAERENYYIILGISQNASIDDMRSAYRKAAMKWHPDKNAENKDAEERFKKISEAYTILSDTNKRKAYDRWLSSQNGNTANFESSSNEFNFKDATNLFYYEMVKLANELTMQNIHWNKIASELILRGCPENIAKTIAKGVEKERKSLVRKSTKRMFLSSIFSIVGGTILTFILLGFGVFVIVGPILILFGTINFVRAIYFLSSGRVPKRH
jgi:hypothetical protein